MFDFSWIAKCAGPWVLKLECVWGLVVCGVTDVRMLVHESMRGVELTAMRLEYAWDLILCGVMGGSVSGRP
jgi:hypothetical protein